MFRSAPPRGGRYRPRQSRYVKERFDPRPHAGGDIARVKAAM